MQSSLPRRPSFETDQPTLARIHRNTWWAIQNNLHGIITDTPVYEKNGWTGDAQLTAPAASLLFDTERLYQRCSRTWRTRRRAQGEVPLLSPSNRNYGYVGKPAFKPVDCCGATPAWDAFWFVIPWESYARYGDLRASSGRVRSCASTSTSGCRSGRHGRRPVSPHAHVWLGDWLPPEGVPTINALVSSAFYARMARIAAETARALGRTPEAARYDDLFQAIRSDFNARFFGDDGVPGEDGGRIRADRAGAAAGL